MTTAQELGLVKGTNYTKLESGQTIEVNGVHRFDNSKNYGEFAVIPTTKGEVMTFGKNIIANLRSEKPQSLGNMIVKAVELKKTLTCYCFTDKYEGNDTLKLSIFKPKA